MEWPGTAATVTVNGPSAQMVSDNACTIREASENNATDENSFGCQQLKAYLICTALHIYYM